MNNYNVSAQDFSDNISQEIFTKRSLFYSTGNWRHLLQLVINVHNHIVRKLRRINNDFISDLINTHQELIIFGAGNNGKIVYQLLSKRGLHDKIIAFCDNDPVKQTNLVFEKKVISPNTIVEYGAGVAVLVPEGTFKEDMCENLLRLGFPRAQIRVVPLDFMLHESIKERDDLSDAFFAENSRITIYGTSHLEFLFLFLLQNAKIEIDFIVDDNPNKKMFHGVPVKSLDVFLSEDNACNIIVFNGLVKQYLINKGIDASRIIHFADTDNWQYFDDEIIPITGNAGEVFLDGGSLNLDTAKAFLKWCGGVCEKIYSFEPDPSNITECEKRLEKDQGLKSVVTLLPKGLWSNDTTLTFNAVNISGASYIQETECPNVDIHKMNVDNQIRLECTSIDNVLHGRKATFIKMDIEGSELEALKGAAQTIRQYHPILAISVYHKPEDIITIPSYIKELVPEYRLYLRTYHEDHTETVLYAIYPQR